MSDRNDQEKTEQPTPKRRIDARKKGNVAHTAEIPSAAVMLSSLAVFFFAGPWMFRQLTALVREIFQNMGTLPLDAASTQHFLWLVLRHTAWILMPLMLAVMIGGIAANIAQVGLLVSGETLVPKFSKLNPISGMQRILSPRSLIELVKSLVKILTVGGVAYVQIRARMDTFPRLLEAGVGDILAVMGRASLDIGLYSCLCLAFLAGLDYLLQRRRHEKDLMMSRQEIKDENRQLEGDQQIRGRIRRIQMDMGRRRMMAAVPHASVVIANPEHLAIAVRYDPKKMAAPIVTAKGADIIAQRIKEVARQNSVPIVENKPLARTLYATVDIGRPIPADLYRAMAEVLAHVYRLRRP